MTTSVVLAALVVLGVLAVLVATIRGARITYSDAAMTVSVTRVTDSALKAVTALQQEGALASVLARPGFEAHARRFADEAIPETDQAIRELTVAWSTQRDRIPETAVPRISDVLVAEATLGEFREAAQSSIGESTFPLYNEMTTLTTAATVELVKQGTDPTTITERAVIVALLTASENLNTQRHLVQQAIFAGTPPSEESLLQLEVVGNTADQALSEARFLAEGEDLEAVEAIRTGLAAETVEETVTSILADRSLDSAVGPLRWYQYNEALLDQVNTLISSLHDRLEAEARADLVRAERSLWSRSILLGALFVVTLLVVGNAVVATRERARALAEYEELTDGLRQWFIPAAFPERDDVRIAARYVPASVRTRSGGDWYDVYEVGDLLALVIGDVAGHGPNATAQMAQLRNVLRGQSTARTLEPAMQIDLLDDTMRGAGILATLTYGLLDVHTGDFVYTRAGHMPLIIRSATGGVRIEEEASGPPVGGGVDLERETAVSRLHPGDTMILVTDGLVERLDRDIDIALEKMAKALTEAGDDTEEMLDLLFSLDHSEAIDDAAALLVTWQPEALDQVT